MPDLINILTTAATSGAVFGLMFWALRNSFLKIMDHALEQRDKRLELQRRGQQRMNDHFIDQQTSLFGEMIETSYRITKALEDGAFATEAASWNPKLRDYCAHLTENLFKFRLYIPEEAFTELHSLKRLAQDTHILLDTLTRPENLRRRRRYTVRQKWFQQQAAVARLHHDKLIEILKGKAGQE